MEIGQWHGSGDTIKLVFGNQYERVENPKYYFQGKEKIKMSHRWCMFLSINNCKTLTQKYIK
jgi:hypothetical protein